MMATTILPWARISDLPWRRLLRYRCSERLFYRAGITSALEDALPLRWALLPALVGMGLALRKFPLPALLQARLSEDFRRVQGRKLSRFDYANNGYAIPTNIVEIMFA